MGFAEAGPTMIALPEPNDRERRARIIGEWLQTEAPFLA